MKKKKKRMEDLSLNFQTHLKNLHLQRKIERLQREKILCSFCKKEMRVNKDNYLKKRYRLKFWNNQEKDTRVICYSCLEYAWNRKLPLISKSRSKQTTFLQYRNRGMFWEYNLRNFKYDGEGWDSNKK